MNGFVFEIEERFADAFSALMPDYLSPAFFDAVERSAEVFLLELWHGSWEVYPAERSLVDAVASRGVGVKSVTSERWPHRAFE